MVLVLMGTFEQVSTGVTVAQDKFFRTFIVYWHPENSTFSLPCFPGGYTLAILLILNLSASFAFRFRFQSRSLGILLTHVGLALLIVGEILTGMLATESQMAMREGNLLNYSEEPSQAEFVVIDKSDPNFDQVVAVDGRQLRNGQEIKLPTLPFTLHIKKTYPNSRLIQLNQKQPLANRGMGTRVGVNPLPKTRKDNQINILSSYIEIMDGDDSLGTWLVSSGAPTPQTLTHKGQDYDIVMRRKRHYLPFTLKLKDFVHERYPGTQIPKNFASRVRLYDTEGDFDRELLITMNHPLRYQSKTFYQSSYGENDTLSILQVVDNSSRLVPYISSAIVTLGLLVQFFTSFHHFRSKQRRAS